MYFNHVLVNINEGTSHGDVSQEIKKEQIVPLPEIKIVKATIDLTTEAISSPAELPVVNQTISAPNIETLEHHTLSKQELKITEFFKEKKI